MGIMDRLVENHVDDELLVQSLHSKELRMRGSEYKSKASHAICCQIFDIQED
jgi:hypothetical protein